MREVIPHVTAEVVDGKVVLRGQTWRHAVRLKSAGFAFRPLEKIWVGDELALRSLEAAYRGQVEILELDGEYVAVGATYEQRGKLRSCGFRWDNNRKCWVGGEESARRYSEWDGLVEQSKQASVEGYSVPSPRGLKYMPFQLAGIRFAVERKRVLIADEMGLGKTIQAIGVINALGDECRRVLVVCPASLRLNWRRELQRWLVRRRPVWFVGDEGWWSAKSAVWIVSYASVRKVPEDAHFDLVVLDEAHYIKNPKAKRTKAAMKLVRQVERAVYLTGTPLMNRPSELWPLVSSLRPDVFNSWPAFRSRYCEYRYTRWGAKEVGGKNLEELAEVLRATVMIRRRKSDVLSELPEKIRQVVELETDAETAEVVRRERAEYERYVSEVAELRAEAELAKAEGTDSWKRAVYRLRQRSAELLAHVQVARHIVALRKVPKVVEHVSEIVEQTGACVVWAVHRDVARKIAEGLRAKGVNAESVSGEVGVDERQRAVDAFQGGKRDVFVGTMGACGTGFTLTRASHCVFAELDWVPAVMQQAEDRLHRIGQKDTVWVHHVVLDGSIDADIARKLVQKQEMIDAVMGGDGVMSVAPSGGGLIGRSELEKRARELTDSDVRRIEGEVMGDEWPGRSVERIVLRRLRESVQKHGWLSPQEAALAEAALNRIRTEREKQERALT